MSNNKPWLQHYPKDIPQTLSYPLNPIQHFLIATAEETPEKIAVHFLGKEITYQEIYESAVKVANYLQGLGIKKGDRVSIMLPNTPQAIISYFGILLAGGVVVQTNPLYTERELAYQLNDSGSKVIIALDSLFPRVVKVMGTTKLEHIIVTAIEEYLPFPKNLLFPLIQKKKNSLFVKVKHEGNYHLLKQILRIPNRNIDPIPFDSQEDLALLQYTGGTTGVPKGVMLTHYNLVSNATMCKHWLYKCRKGEEIILGLLPFFHVYGMTAVMLLAVMEGYKMVLLPQFDAETTLKTIQKQRPTIFPGAPSIYIRLLNHCNINKYDLSSIETCISGSAALPIEVQQKFEKMTGGKLVEGYGLTETSPVTHANFLWAKSEVKGSIGVPWPDTDAKILSLKTQEPLSSGQIGEIAVKGPQVMKGYWNSQEETDLIWKDGWLLTGDLGYMDDKGYFYMVDRKKDVIIAGGLNIYPREIEEVLYEHPYIQEACVLGIPDPNRGETVKAFIVLKNGTTITEEELDFFCRKYLAPFKVPKVYEFRTELPKTAVGKVLRRALLEEESNNLENKAM